MLGRFAIVGDITSLPPFLPVTLSRICLLELLACICGETSRFVFVFVGDSVSLFSIKSRCRLAYGLIVMANCSCKSSVVL
jgi:hypothetical protein